MDLPSRLFTLLKVYIKLNRFAKIFKEREREKMKGQVSHELEVNVPAAQAWELYGTIKLAKLVEKESDTVEEIEIVEGDGGVGTILHLKFTPGRYCLLNDTLFKVINFLCFMVFCVF